MDSLRGVFTQKPLKGVQRLHLPPGPTTDDGAQLVGLSCSQRLVSNHVGTHDEAALFSFFSFGQHSRRGDTGEKRSASTHVISHALKHSFTAHGDAQDRLLAPVIDISPEESL